jgi:DNA-directed RNA polymerase subunit RPC12/RpoP
MNWFYSLDGRQNGPVSDAQLDELLRSGKINHDTSVWREGMTDWQPLNIVRSGAPPPVPSQQSILVCVECGKTFPPSELIQINHSSVCAGCKPIFLQRLSEGVAVPASVGLWRKKKQIVTVSETVFPDRCVKCNAPANGFRLKRILYWQHPAYLLLLLCNLLILLIVVLIVRKKAIVHIGLCEKHRAQRKVGLAVGWTGALGGIVLIIGGVAFKSGWTVLAGVAAFLFGCIYGGIRASTVAATKITKENVWIRGARREFLDTLPEWPGL